MSTLQQFLYSFYNFNLVSTFRFFNFFNVVKYILLISLIVFLPKGIVNVQELATANKRLNNFLAKPEADLTFKDGRLSSNINTSTYFSLTDGLTVIVDPNDTLTDEQTSSHYHDHILIKSDKIRVVSPTNTNEFTYKMLGFENMTKSDFENTFSNWLLWFFIYFFTLLFLYLSSLITVLILVCIVAFLGRIISSLMFIKLTYIKIWKLTIYASTLPFVYTSIITLLGIPNNFLHSVVWYITLIILMFILNCAKKRQIT